MLPGPASLRAAPTPGYRIPFSRRALTASVRMVCAAVLCLTVCVVLITRAMSSSSSSSSSSWSWPLSAPAPAPAPSTGDTGSAGDGDGGPFAAYATALEDETWAARERQSSFWAPMAVRECTHLTPAWFAPCVAARSGYGSSKNNPTGGHAHAAAYAYDTTRMYAEELIYPDFVLPIPVFVGGEQGEQQKAAWVAKVAGLGRGVYERKEGEEVVAYKAQHGQNFVLQDVEFTPPGHPDSWAGDSCMGPHSRLSGLKVIPLNATGTEQHAFSTDAAADADADAADAGSAPAPDAAPAPATETAIVVNTPDSWSFQHFMDRVTHILAQAAHLSPSPSYTSPEGAAAEDPDPDTDTATDEDTDKDTEAHAHVHPHTPRPIAITGRRGSDFVNELWDRMGYTERRHLGHDTMRLKRLIWSCKTVLIHPYLSWKTLEMLGLPWTDTRATFDTSRKKAIMYVSRSDGHADNGGREVRNERAVLDAIESLLARRQKDERLEMFDPAKFPTLTSLADYFSTHVAAVVGPHGGGLMNHRFAGPDVLVLEFMPTSRIEWINWEEVSMLNQTYAAIIVEPAQGSRDDMVVDPAHVVELLDKHMGPPTRFAVVSYMWDKE